MSAATPLPFERERSMSSPVIEEKTSQRSFAREISTFRRRSPPSEFSGPKLIAMNPSFVFPYPSEMKMTSRSSPWMFSRFFTKNGSLVPRPKKSSVSGCSRLSSSSSFWIA